MSTGRVSLASACRAWMESRISRDPPCLRGRCPDEGTSGPSAQGKVRRC